MRVYRLGRHPFWEEIRVVGVAAVVTIACCWLVAWYFWSLFGPLE